MPGKLLVPKVVSYNGYTKRGYLQKGTKAFVEHKTRLPRGLKREQKWRALREIAGRAEFFIKPLSKRNQRIRKMLEKYGIRAEKVVQPLGNGTALFQKEGFSFDSAQGIAFVKKNPKKAITALQETFAKMTVLEIYHNHPHMGNFAITLKGEIIVLDLGKATMGRPERIRRSHLSEAETKKLSNNLGVFCDSLSLYYFRRILGREPELRELQETQTKFWTEIHEKMGQIFPEMSKQLLQNRKNAKLAKKK